MAATRALASLKDSRVGDLARLRLREENFSAERSDEVELFKNNYLPGDENIIVSALARVKAGHDDMHYIGMRALHVCQANPDIRLIDIASFIYRTNPCTLCRRDVLEWMKEVGSLPAWIANEARFDASEETRALIAAANAEAFEF